MAEPLFCRSGTPAAGARRVKVMAQRSTEPPSGLGVRLFVRGWYGGTTRQGPDRWPMGQPCRIVE